MTEGNQALAGFGSGLPDQTFPFSRSLLALVVFQIQAALAQLNPVPFQGRSIPGYTLHILRAIVQSSLCERPKDKLRPKASAENQWVLPPARLPFATPPLSYVSVMPRATLSRRVSSLTT